MRRRWRVLFPFVLLLALVPAAGTAGADPNRDGPRTGPNVDTSSVLVQLQGDPLSTSPKTKPAHGKKVDFSSATVKSERARLAAQRNDFKQWLQANARKAKVTGEYDIALNAVAVQLNGESADTIARAPQVVRVQYQGVYTPLDDSDPDLSIISAQAAWAVGGGAANAGESVKVAIIDTGIDVTHPCFSDAGYPTQTQLGDHQFTNNKVIAAKVFYNKASVKGLTPAPVQDHGTHVAGTVACNLDTPATVQGVDIPYDMSGVAPRALLGNYNVFPGDVDNARSEDIVDALEAAYADGFDVANMSLGGNSHGMDDLLSAAVDDLDVANMVVAVAAGNSGPGHFTVESPGKAARALSAGASTVGHFVGAPVTVAGTTSGAAVGDFATVTSDVTAPLGVVTSEPTDPNTGLGTACLPLPAGSLTGQIALISRGTCFFSEKILNAQNAGAVVVLVVNNVAGDPTAMGAAGLPVEPTVPAYMVGNVEGEVMATHPGESTTVGADLTYVATANSDIMAGFSSQGPTDTDFRVKPDVVAPGVNVLSSIPAAFCDAPPCFAFFQGTSMATPHLAGSAAVVRQQHPDWSAAEVRSAIVNTADQGVLRDSLTGTTIVTDVNIIGAGRENLLSAVNAVAALDPVSTSFGAVPSGSGQTRSASVTITNLSGSSATFSLAVTSTTGSGVVFSANPSSVTLAPGASTTVTIAMASAKKAAAGDHQALLTVSSGGTEVAHAAIYTFVK